MTRINELVGQEITVQFENGSFIEGTVKVENHPEKQGGNAYFLVSENDLYRIYSRGKRRITPLGDGRYIQKDKKNIIY